MNNNTKLDSDSINRLQWLDMLRALAILLVVLCHCIQGVFDYSIDALKAIPFLRQLVMFILFTLGRLAVPFFLMMTGYLLLDKRYSNQDCESFWKKKWIPLLISTEFWFITYDCLLMLLGYEDFDLLEIIEDIFFLRAINMTHVWFMPMILGLYILIPFVANAISDFRPRELKFPTIIFSFFAFAFPIIQVIEICNDDFDLSLQFSLSFCGGAYGLYLIYGYFVKKNALKKLPVIFLVMNSLLFFALSIWLQMYNVSCENTYNLWYNCGFLALTALSLFELASRINHIPFYLNIIFRFLSRYSFAIYLVHNIYRSLLIEYVTAMHLDEMHQLIILFMLTILTTLPTVCLIDKIPFVGKRILYMR